MVVGYDSDWYYTAADFSEVILTSVLKNVDVAVFETIQDAASGRFTGGTVTYTLRDGGVGLAPFHDLDGAVPADLKAELEAVRLNLVSGELSVESVLGQ